MTVEPAANAAGPATAGSGFGAEEGSGPGSSMCALPDGAGLRYAAISPMAASSTAQASRYATVRIR